MPEPTENASATPRGPVDELVAQVLDGEPQTLQERLEQTCQRHPDQAARLRRRVELLVDAGFVDSGEVELPDRLGEFRLVAPIGEGGMGVVYRARQESLDREVAVKLIRPEELRFPGARERFAREVTTIARLSHPGIVPVYAVGEEGGVPYFAMELVRGATLAQLLAALPERPGSPGRRGAELDGALARVLGEPGPSEAGVELAPLFRGTWEQTALRIVRAVADALEHAHGSSVLHRDVKPSNIMLTRDGRVMLLDFGLSSVEGSERLTRTGVQVGSFAYMAPELLADTGAADRRSEVYALGVTLYELLAGRLPFSARSLAALRTQVLEARPRSLRRDRARGQRVSWEAETVCLVAMDVDRRRRYASAGELARDLDSVLAGRPITARRPGPVLRARRFAGRHPAWTAAVLLLLLAVPVTWAVGERVARVNLSRANAALAESLAEVQRQESRADANFVLARDAVDRMLDRLGDVRLRDVPHLETLRRDVLKDALSFHEALVEAEPEDPEERLEYVRSLGRVADMHGLLTEFDEVAETLNHAWRSLEQMIAEDADPRYVDQLGQVAWRLVEAENYRGNLDEALRVGREARETLAAHGVDRARERHRLARLDVQLAGVLQRAGETEEARETLQRTVAELRELRARDELVGDGPGLLATALTDLGQPQAFLVQGDASAAELELQAGYLREALELRRVIAQETSTPDSRFAVVETLIDLAANLFTRGEYRAAVETYDEARTAVEQLVQDYPSVTSYLDARAAISLNQGSQFTALGELERAEESFGHAARAYEDLHRLRPDQRGLGVRRLIAMQSWVDARVELERITPELLSQLDEAEALSGQLARTETGQGAAIVARLGGPRTLLRGKILVQLGRIDDAVELARALEDAADASVEPLLQAVSFLSLCVGADLPDEHAEELAIEAIDVLARALELDPDPVLVGSYLGTDMFDPLRAEPGFAELLAATGLERWIER